MKRLKIILAMLTIFLLTTTLAFPQVETTGNFIIKIIRAMGLEKNLPPGYTADMCLKLLRDMGIIEPSLVVSLMDKLDKPLTNDVMALILVDVWNLENKLPKSPKPQDYINLLVEYGVMRPGAPGEVVTVQEVAGFFENPVAASALAEPYLQPISPVKPG